MSVLGIKNKRNNIVATSLDFQNINLRNASNLRMNSITSSSSKYSQNIYKKEQI